MKATQLFMPTLRDMPSDLSNESVQYLLRAGFMRQMERGVMGLLPLGLKLESQLVNSMKAIENPDLLWNQTGFPVMKFKNIQERMITCLEAIQSYKQLPFAASQLMTYEKESDQYKMGLVFAKHYKVYEGISVYSNVDEAEENLAGMSKALEERLNDWGLKPVPVDEKGLNNDEKHIEWLLPHQEGDQYLLSCPKCGYRGSERSTPIDLAGQDSSENVQEDILSPEKVHTPDVKTIEDLEQFLNRSSRKMIKAIMLKDRETDQYYAVFVPGYRSLSMEKLSKETGIHVNRFEFLDEDEITLNAESSPGFSGPIGLADRVLKIADSRLFQIRNGICGANEKDYHWINVNLARQDFRLYDDLLEPEEGDFCGLCQEPFVLEKAFSVARLTQCSAKDMKNQGLQFLDAQGKAQPLHVNTFVCGISRILGLIADKHVDDMGLKWPIGGAPFDVIINVVNAKKEDHLNHGLELYEVFKSRGLSVLLDDRLERAGVKFKDMDMMGMPIRINIGKSIGEGKVEYSLRKDCEKKECLIEDILVIVERLINEKMG